MEDREENENVNLTQNDNLQTDNIINDFESKQKSINNINISINDQYINLNNQKIDTIFTYKPEENQNEINSNSSIINKELMKNFEKYYIDNNEIIKILGRSSFAKERLFNPMPVGVACGMA